jgi:uncharacterized protein
MKEVRLRVWRIEAQSATNYLLWLLDDDQHPLPMSIGPCEAMAIEGALRANGNASRTAASHDLVRALISNLGGQLTKIVIDDLWNGVYYAKLHLAVNGETLAVDSRPSDAIAIALRGEVPLYATDVVMAAANEEASSLDQDEPEFR